MKGVLDRFEGLDAVILIEEENEEFTVPRTKLPKGSSEGVWFHLIKENSTYHIQSIDVAATEEKSSANATLMENLRKNKKGSKFKR
ncbi:MAG TPA: DUF3006 domain-containing protein [Pseudogracilibacillus sp.]|nr:DUF3006 domain-containing protein [Pseudogracilibacillus sp.]